MKNKFKIALIMGLIIIVGTIMVGCGTPLEETVSNNDVNIIVNVMESEPMLGIQEAFDFQNLSMSFYIEGLEEGILSLSTDTVAASPASIEFTDGKVEIENLFTYAKDDLLMVKVESYDGEISVVTTVELPGAEVSTGDEQIISVLANTPIHSDHVTGFFIDQSFSGSFNYWIYMDAGHVRTFGPLEQRNLLDHLQANPYSSYYAIGNGGDGYFDTWSRYSVVGSANLEQIFRNGATGLYYSEQIYKFTDAMVDKDVYTHLTGNVIFEVVDVDDNSKKIENAKISLNDVEKTTDINGNATITAKAGMYGYTVTHEDYDTLVVSVDSLDAIEIAQPSQNITVELKFAQEIDVNNSSIVPSKLEMEPDDFAYTIVTVKDQEADGGNPYDISVGDLSIIQDNGDELTDYDWINNVTIDYSYGNDNQAQITIYANQSNTGSANDIVIQVNGVENDVVLTSSFEVIVDYIPAIDYAASYISDVNPDPVTAGENFTFKATLIDQYGNPYTDLLPSDDFEIDDVDINFVDKYEDSGVYIVSANSTVANVYSNVDVSVKGDVVGQFSIEVIPAEAATIQFVNYEDEIIIPGKDDIPAVEQFSAVVVDGYGNSINPINLNWELVNLESHLTSSEVSIDQSGNVTVTKDALLRRQPDALNIGSDNAFKVKASMDSTSAERSVDLVLADSIYGFDFRLGRDDTTKRVGQLFWLTFELGEYDQYDNPRPQHTIYNILVESDKDGTVYDEEVRERDFENEIYMDQIELDTEGMHLLTATVSFDDVTYETDDTPVDVYPALD